MLHVPGAAAAVQRASHHQAKDGGPSGGHGVPGNEHQGTHGLAAAQGRGQTPRHRQQQGALQQGVEGEKGRVVEEFLGYARQVPTELEAVRLHPLLAQSVALVPQDLAVTLDFAPDQEVQADPSGLGRLALNLMRNAAQAGARSMRITYGPGAVLRFRDDGPGVPAEIAERIFEAFYTTREKGTGLGLALCAKLAAAHGGRLTLENPGQAGACFALTLSAPPRRGDQARPPSA